MSTPAPHVVPLFATPFGVVSLPVTDTRLTIVLIHRDELVLIAPAGF